MASQGTVSKPGSGWPGASGATAFDHSRWRWLVLLASHAWPGGSGWVGLPRRRRPLTVVGPACLVLPVVAWPPGSGDTAKQHALHCRRGLPQPAWNWTTVGVLVVTGGLVLSLAPHLVGMGRWRLVVESSLGGHGPFAPIWLCAAGSRALARGPAHAVADASLPLEPPAGCGPACRRVPDAGR